MLISFHWLCKYLPTPAPTVEQVESVLIHAGFPIEQRTQVGADTLLDVEITSNRGDCLSHLGLAREVAAKLGLTLRPPAAPLAGGPTGAPRGFTLHNTTPGACPLFTARVLRGVKVGPSPAWLRTALETVGQRSINNVVDVTNFVCSELGNPSHVFDLRKLDGGSLSVRWAREGETLTTLDGKARRLTTADLVVADDQRAQSLAGVIGGQDSQVDASTVDVVLEVATWDPVCVRHAARRHQVRTDASHRFERLVMPGTLHSASDRAASLLLEVAGGSLDGGLVTQGPGAAHTPPILLRPDRCRHVLGFEVDTAEMASLLSRLGVESGPSGRGGGGMLCTPPAFRPDLTREIDLIEEIGRVRGLDAITVHEALAVTVRPPQATEAARAEIGRVLTGLGFYETITFSFTTPKLAELFMPAGNTSVEVDDDRRGDEPALRPSVLTGLLGCRRKNQNSGATEAGEVRLFELAAVFGQRGGASIENLNLGLLLDIPTKGHAASTAELQHGVRLLRGAIESLVRLMGGPAATLDIEPATPHCPAFDPAAYARLSLGGVPLGFLGVLSKACTQLFGLDAPVVGAEVSLAALVAPYPPKITIQSLPEFPGTERDISLIVPEEVRWAQVERTVRTAAAPPLQEVSFVTTYRGEQIGAGKKSLTLRLHYRDATRTLRREEVDAAAAAVLDGLKKTFDATIRT